MNFRDRAKPQHSGFQLAPMIDVVFLLLIFFIVTWNFARWETEIDVTVPTAKEGAESRRSVGEIIINVNKDGGILVNRQRLRPDELLERLRRIASLYPDQAIILRGDREASYDAIVRVLDICREANIWNVAFATTKPAEEG